MMIHAGQAAWKEAAPEPDALAAERALHSEWRIYEPASDAGNLRWIFVGQHL